MYADVFLTLMQHATKLQIKVSFPIQTIEPHASQLLTHTEFICDAAKVGQKAIPRLGTTKPWLRFCLKTSAIFICHILLFRGNFANVLRNLKVTAIHYQQRILDTPSKWLPSNHQLTEAVVNHQPTLKPSQVSCRSSLGDHNWHKSPGRFSFF